MPRVTRQVTIARTHLRYTHKLLKEVLPLNDRSAPYGTASILQKTNKRAPITELVKFLFVMRAS